MPLELPDHRMDWAKIEGGLWGSISRGDPMYRPAVAAIRRCRTMYGATGAAGRLRHYFLFLAERGIAPAEATRDDISDWVASFGSDHPANAECHLAHVKVMYDDAVERGVVARNPAARISVGRYTQQQLPALELDEVRCLLEGIRSELDEPGRRLVAARDLALLTLLVSVGPRSSELRAISWGDLRIDGDVPSVQLYGKGRAHRTIRLPAVAVAAVRVYRDVLIEHGITPGPEDAITIGLSARNQRALHDPASRPLPPMSKEGLGSLVRERLDSIGVTGARRGPHRLRATAATLAHLADAPVVAIATMLGHARVDTTVRSYIVPANALASSPADRVHLLDDLVEKKEGAS